MNSICPWEVGTWTVTDDPGVGPLNPMCSEWSYFLSSKTDWSSACCVGSEIEGGAVPSMVVISAVVLSNRDAAVEGAEMSVEV